jgi:UDP-N-acetylglucosamine 2-epimerase
LVDTGHDTTEWPEGIAAGILKLSDMGDEVIYITFKQILEDKD